MGNFGSGEDITFSMGLNGLSLVDNLAATEQKVSESLSRIGASFDALNKKIGSTGGAVSLGGVQKKIDSVTKSARALVSLLNSPARSQGLTLVEGQLAKIDERIAKINSKPLTISGQRTLADLSRLREQIIQLSGPIDNAAGKLNGLHLSGQTLNQTFQQAGGILRNVSTVLSTIGIGGGIFALVAGFKSLVKEGIELNSQIEQAKISLSAEVVSSAKMVEVNGQRVEGLKAISAVQETVGRTVEKLKLDAIFVNGTFADLLGIAQAIAPVVLRMGGNMEQVHRLTQLAGIAASVLGVSFEEAATGLTQLLNGNYVGRNNFVKRLPADVNELKAAIKDSSTAADYLIGVMGKLESAGPLLARGFKGALDSVRDTFMQLSGEVFDPLKNKLQAAFNEAIDPRNGKLFQVLPDGTKKWSQDVETTLTRVSRLVDSLINQVVVLSQGLFSSSGKSFLDTAEEVLPAVISYVFSLLGIVKTLVSTMVEHGAMVLKVLGYYMSFKLMTGVFQSIVGSVRNVAGAMASVRGLINDAVLLTKYWTGAVIETRAEYEAAAAKAAALGATLKAALAGTGIMLLIVAVTELGRGLWQAHEDSVNLRNSLNDINNVKFDGAMEQLRRLKESIKNTGFWNSVTSGHTTKGKLEQDISDLGSIPTAAKQRLMSAATAMSLPLTGLTGDTQSADLAALVIKEARKRKDDIDAAYAKANPEQKRQLDDQTKALNDDIKAGEGMLRVLRDFGEAFDLAKEKIGWASQQGIDTSEMDLGKFYGFSKAAQRVGSAEASLDHTTGVTITPGKPVKDTSGLERQLEENQTRLMNALEQVAQAASRVADRNAQAAVDKLDEQVKKHLLTTQEAADREIGIAQDTYDKKVKAQEAFFNQLDNKGLADLTGAKASLGLGGGGKLSFAELTGLSDSQLTQAIADLEGKAATGDKNKQADFKKQIADLQTLLKIWSAFQQEQGKLQATTAQATERRTGAEEKARDYVAEQNALIAERNAQLAVEQATLSDQTGALDARLQRERELTRLVVARQQADVDKRTLKEIASTNARTDIGQSEKDALNSKTLSTADLEKRYIAAKGEVDLAKQLIAIKDQEIDLSQQGTQVKEIELSTLRDILGAENPIVAQKARELALEKAANLEQKAQARYDAATELRKSGQNTAAREAEKQGDILTAQAQQLKDQTEQYFQVIANGIGQLSGLLGKFSGLLGTTTSGFSQLVNGITNLSRTTFGSGKAAKTGISAVFAQGKGTASGIAGAFQGALSVADAVAPIAGTAIDLLTGFFNLFNAGWKKLLQEAHDKVDKELNATLDSLNTGAKNITETVRDLQTQYNNVESKYPKPKSAPWWSWIMPVVGAAWTIGSGISNEARQEAIDNDRLEIMRELDKLAQDAADTIYKLEHDTLPSLRVPRSMRDYEDALTKIRTELQQIAGTPGITEADLEALYNARITDLQAEMGDKVLDERQNYLDVLKQEKSLKDQIADIDKQEADIQDNYTKQRMEILGYASRELSKAEQLAQLEKDKKDQLDALEKQKADLQQQLEYTQQQKGVYEEIFGVVTDIGEYQKSVQDQLVAKTKEQLGALSTFWQELTDWIENSSMWNFITNNGATIANGNPYALPPILTTPGPVAGPTLNINGDININGDATESDVRRGFLDAWNEINQTNAARGLAFSNA